MKHWLIAAALLLAGAARADALDTLKDFVRDAKTGKAAFSQVVTSSDGKRTKTAQGSFEFARPDRFRFEYAKPYQQLIVADGRKVWLYDMDLNQVTVRPAGEALGATPAALLSGTDLERDFNLTAQPDQDGLQWVLAQPKQKEGATFQTLRVGFRGNALAAIEVLDALGQRARLDFTGVTTNVSVPADRFRFTPPAGADVVEQP